MIKVGTSLVYRPCWCTSGVILGGGSDDRWRIGSEDWKQCQKPVGFTLDHRNWLLSASWCSAEACVSTLESHVRNTKRSEGKTLARKAPGHSQRPSQWKNTLEWYPFHSKETQMKLGMEWVGYTSHVCIQNRCYSTLEKNHPNRYGL